MFSQKLLKRKSQIELELISLKKEIEMLPAGELHCTCNGKYIKWFNHHEGHIDYIPKKQKEFAGELALRRYKTTLMKELEVEKQAIEAYLKCKKKNSRQAVDMLNDSSGFKQLLVPYFGTYHYDIDDWMKESYEKNTAHPEHLIHKTIAGFNVRSKSESLIVSALYMNHIPFRYECALHLGDITVFPDFTIMHPRTKKIYYLEHFGMMDNPDYIHSTYRKLQLYSENGIVPSVNLITTFETTNSPLDYEILENLIHFYFL